MRDIPWPNLVAEPPFHPYSYIFIEYNTAEEAEAARAKMDRYPFDAKHRFHVNILSDIDTFADMDDAYVEPEPEEFTPRVSLLDCPMCELTVDTGAFACMAWRSPGAGSICDLPSGRCHNILAWKAGRN